MVRLRCSFRGEWLSWLLSDTVVCSRKWRCSPRIRLVTILVFLTEDESIKDGRTS